MEITFQDIKDIAQLAITLMALWISYRSISIQVKKNRKDLWIHDFRTEMARFLSLTMSTVHSNTGKLEEISHSGMMIRMFLNLKEKQHQDLLDVIARTTKLVVKAPNNIKGYADNMEEILKLADEIIKKEQDKI